VQDETKLHLQYQGVGERRTLAFANGDSESLLLTQLSPEQFRVEESSVLSEVEIYYHDVIRAAIRADGSLEFRELVSRSGLRTQIWVLPEGTIESVEFRPILDSVMKAGGNWEQVFGGVLFVHVPPPAADSIHERIKILLKRQP
jgi:hypothetical protein